MPRAEMTARRFHDGTKHPNGDLLDPRHRYDPSWRPPMEKQYPGSDAVELSSVEPGLDVSALDAIASREPLGEVQSFDLESLAHFLHFSNGVTKRLRMRGGGRMPFRAASCTGALYHIELYLGCGELDELEPGLYAYQPEAHSLVRLRGGDPRASLAQASGNGERIREAPLTVIYSSAYWRNAFKYQARAYRHVFWDAGTVLANSLALAASLGWEAQLQLGYVDRSIEQLLGIETEPGLPVCLLPLGRGAADQEGSGGQLLTEPERPQGYRFVWPAIEAAQRATELESQDEAGSWLTSAREIELGRPRDGNEGVVLPAPEQLPSDAIDEVIRRRGSSRRFTQDPIRSEQLSAILNRALVGTPMDAAPEGRIRLAEPYLLVNAVEGLDPGVYRAGSSPDELISVRGPNELNRRTAAELALGQALGADAAVNIYFLADWDAILAYGERGYRLAQLEGGVLGGRLYLAAYALGLGATGLTFFDDAVASAFSRDPNQTAVLFLTAIGHPA